MIFLDEYTYFIRKDNGFIVLGKFRGVKFFGQDYLFAAFIKEKRINLHWIKKYIFEGKGELVAQLRVERTFFWPNTMLCAKRRLKESTLLSNYLVLKYDQMKIIATQETTVEKLISEKMKDISKSKIKQWIKYEMITVNEKLVTRTTDTLKPQDILLVTFHKSPTAGKIFKPDFEVLWEDKYLVAALKPAGILSVGETTDRNPSFFKLVQNYVRENSRGKEELFVIHRLDREVSGILLFAKSEFIQAEMKDHWKENTKCYLALVEGVVKKREGTIDSFLAEDPQTLKVYSTDDPEAEDCKHAVTHYRILEILKDKTLLEIQLETGRKNQIRVHLSELGHPIIGDRRYGADDTFERQIRLHAYYLKFKHPYTKAWIEIKVPMPASFLHLPEKDEHYK